MKTTGRARVAAVFAACLIAAPTTLAGPVFDGGGSNAGGPTAPSPRAAQSSTSIASPTPTPRIARLDGGHSIPAGPVPTVISVHSSGFDWNDAGAGFGVAFGLALLAGGSLLVTRRPRANHLPRRTA